MKEYKILGETLYYDPSRSVFSLSPLPFSTLLSIQTMPKPEAYALNLQPTAYTICLNISDRRNLHCDYCFHPKKTQGKMRLDTALSSLETFFRAFPNGEKYYVDLSGFGEPLLALDLVFPIAEWCRKRQDIIRREILVQFVSNGTLLTPNIAKKLQEYGILFGVSLDGPKSHHDKHRKSQEGKGTYDLILRNINGLPDRTLLGCAVTLTHDCFPLLEAFQKLKKHFPTISFRFARGDQELSESSVERWCAEFDHLASHLLEECKCGNINDMLSLLNGDDLLGRYLCLCLSGVRAPMRCDSGISRFCFNQSGEIYGCPPLSIEKRNCLKFLSSHEATTIVRAKAQQCSTCEFKFFCGGECQVEMNRLGQANEYLCQIRKHLVLLAMFITCSIQKNNLRIFSALQSFVYQKQNRDRQDPDLEDFLKRNPSLSFTEGKKLYDKTKNQRL